MLCQTDVLELDLKYDDCNVPHGLRDTCDFCLTPNATCHPAPHQPKICDGDFDGSKSNSNLRFSKMRDALQKQNRPILYSLCNQGKAGVQNWGPGTGQSWRATDDIFSTLTLAIMMCHI
jgi:alpha-galactosidase